MILSKCKKFELLLCEQEDRQLSEKESQFVQSHKNSCLHCSKLESAQGLSLNLLRHAVLESESNSNYESLVTRKIKLTLGRESFNYWMPAILSASIAAIGAFALMQLLSQTPNQSKVNIKANQANNANVTNSPLLILPKQSLPVSIK